MAIDHRYWTSYSIPETVHYMEFRYLSIAAFTMIYPSPGAPMISGTWQCTCGFRNRPTQLGRSAAARVVTNRLLPLPWPNGCIEINGVAWRILENKNTSNYQYWNLQHGTNQIISTNKSYWKGGGKSIFLSRIPLKRQQTVGWLFWGICYFNGAESRPVNKILSKAFQLTSLFVGLWQACGFQHFFSTRKSGMIYQISLSNVLVTYGKVNHQPLWDVPAPGIPAAVAQVAWISNQKMIWLVTYTFSTAIWREKSRRSEQLAQNSISCDWNSSIIPAILIFYAFFSFGRQMASVKNLSSQGGLGCSALRPDLESSRLAAEAAAEAAANGSTPAGVTCPSRGWEVNKVVTNHDESKIFGIIPCPYAGFSL